MSKSIDELKEQSTGRHGLAARLEEIRKLEKQLIELKQEFIEASAIPTDDETDENEATFLLIQNADRLFAIPITHVDEVVQSVELISLPEEVKAVAGLVDYHGEIMAVIDFGVLFGFEKRSISSDLILLICTSEILRFAIVVEDVADVLSVHKKEIHVADEVLPGALKALGVLQNRAVILDVLSIILSIQLDKLRDSIAPSSPSNGSSPPERD